MCNEVRETFSLDWDNWVTYSFDNTNYMIGQRNSLLQKIWSAPVDVDCLCHLAHLCAGMGAKELSVSIKDFVIKDFVIKDFTITFAGVQNEKHS